MSFWYSNTALFMPPKMRLDLPPYKTMKTTPKDRKDKVEMVLMQAQKLDGHEAVQAWRRLCRELEHMTQPESKMPRFNTLLHACWIAASNDQT